MNRIFTGCAAGLIGLAFAVAPAQAAVAAAQGTAPMRLGVWTAPAAPLHINTGGMLKAPLSGASLSAVLPALTAPVVRPSLAVPAVAAPASPVAAAPQALPLSPEASQRIGAAVQNISERGAQLAPSEAHGAGIALENAITGGQSFAPAASVSAPDDYFGWYDRSTGQRETETSKLRKTYQLALTNPRAKAIKDNLPVNTVYKVQKGDNPFYARTEGDDPERPGEEAAVIFDEWALHNLSPHFLAATLASMWVRHLYRDVVPQSAEKTYMEGSVLIRTFMELTGSTSRNWVGRLDHWLKDNFQIYRHFYHWVKGFQYDNVRQGPYFKEKIMGAKGDPTVHTDARGRKTLFQRAQAGEISEEAAQAGQEKFDQFVRTEKQ
ncbi:MAG: hypothetical protein PHU21_02795 [Elusimicrobia bacterium]|nr:hypothetical protein [Elusimicrobiota bacterium]